MHQKTQTSWVHENMCIYVHLPLTPWIVIILYS